MYRYYIEFFNCYGSPCKEWSHYPFGRDICCRLLEKAVKDIVLAGGTICKTRLVEVED